MPAPLFAWTLTTAEILDPVVVNDHGTAVPDWSQPPTVALVSGCSWQPSSGSLDDINREGVRGAATLLMPPATAVDAHQRVRVDGVTYRIVGEPERWPSPTGRLDHVLLHLEKWKG